MPVIISTNKQGIALNGFDVMAYRDGHAMMGIRDYAYEWDGVTFWFVSKQNQEAFSKNPPSRIPEYGGHCAFGMAFGKAVHADPNVFTFVNDKIFLNASPMARLCWRWFGSITMANSNWEIMKKSCN